MSRAWIRWTAAALLVAAVAATAAGSLLADEPRSAFAGSGGPAALVEDARLQGLGVQRLVAGPLGLEHDAALDPERTLLVVAGPPRAHSAEEAQAALGFVARGGRLLVADDFGQANGLAVALGVAFERVRLVEPPQAPKPTMALDGRDYTLGLSSPTALHLPSGSAARVLAWSSASSFLDRDGDGIIGPSDPPGPFPLVAELTPEGSPGLVLAAADLDLLGAGGADLEQNRAWRQALLAYALPDGGTVLVDEGQAATDPGLRALGAAVAAAAAPPWRYVLLGVAALLLLGLAAPYALDRWKAHRFRPHRFLRRSALAAQPDPRAAHGAPAAPRSHWTGRGVAAILAAGALAALAFLFGSAEAAYASGALLCALALAGLPRLPRLHARRRLSTERTDESSDVQVRLEVTHGAGRAGELEFRDHLPGEFEVPHGTSWFRARLPRQPLHVEYTVRPALRGPYLVGPLDVRLEDPLGLHVREARLADGTPLRVNPRAESVRKIPFRTRVPTITLGPHLVNRAGDGSEFHALRTYQTGDSYRMVNWKASARSKDLMVNQRVHESMTRLAIFLDARLVSAAGPASTTPLAHGCRAVLSVAAGALRVRDRIRIVVYGNGVQELPPMPGSRQLHELTELLSGLPAAGDTPFARAVQQVLPTLKGGTPVMLASGLEADPSVLDGMRLLRSRGLLPFAIVPPLGTRPVDKDEGGPEPDADALDAARRTAIAQLQSLGVPVFDAVPNVPLDYLFRTGGGL